MEGVYLIHTREFIKSDETIYKLGRSFTLDNRVKQYPNGSKILLMIACEKSVVCESKLIEIFKIKFIQKKYYGNEYFEGDYKLMIKEIFNYIDKMNIENIEKDKKDKIEKAAEKKKQKKEVKKEKEKEKVEEKINNNSDRTCPKCSHKFKYPSMLKMHFTSSYHCLLTKEQINLFFNPNINFIKCNKCEQVFKQKSSLYRHQRNVKCNKSNFLK